MKLTRAVAVVTAALLMVVVLPVTNASAAPAAPVITGYPVGTIGSNNASFTFHTPGATGYQCRVFPTGTAEGSRPTYASCTGSAQGYHQVTGLADGAWTVEVRAVDGTGPGPSSTRDWAVTSDPVVQWISEPQGNYSSRWVTATFTAPGATSFQCRLNGLPAGWGTCSGTSGQQGMWQSAELADGSYTLEVRAVDGANVGPVASASFTVGGGMSIDWLSKPQGNYSSRWVTATFTAPGATSFQCRLNEVPAGWGTCSGTSGQQGMWQSAELADGSYTLEVRAVDGANVGSVASASFTVGGGMSIDWLSKPQGNYSSRWVTATFTAPGATSFQCRLNGLPAVWGTCSGTSGQQGMWQSAELADGSYTLEVRAVDGANVGPVVTAPFAVGNGLAPQWIAKPEGTISAGWVTATFTAPGASSFQCRLNGLPAGWGTCSGTSGQQGMWQSAELADGSYTLEVRAVDGANVGPVVTAPFAVATSTGSSLDVSVVSGPGEGLTIPSSWAAFSWVAPAAQCYRHELDGTPESLASQGCATGSFYESRNFTSLPDGPHTLRVQARSAGGTYGPVLTRTFTVVSGAVTGMSVVSGPGEGLTIPSSWAAFSWSAPAAQCYRHELDGTPESLASQGCATGSFYESRTFTSLPDGPHTLRVQARSAGGTYGPVLTRTFTVVSGAVTGMSVVSGPGEGLTIPSSWAAFSWSAPAAQCYRHELDGTVESLASQGCANGSFYESRTFTTLPDGDHVLRVQARSAGGTYGPVLTRTFTVVSGAVTGMSVVSGPGEGLTIPSSWAAFSWSAPAAQCYRHELDGTVESLASQGCANGSFYESRTFTSLADGDHVLRVQARSAGGTDGPVLTRTFTVRAGPLVSVWSRPRTVLPTGVAAMAWSAPAAQCYRHELDGTPESLASQGCATGSFYESRNFTGLADGPHTLRVQARSAGGAFGPVSSTTFTVETKAPQTTVTARPPGVANSTTAVFEFTADEPATFQCRLDGGSLQPCSSPWTRTSLSQGDHTVEIVATDLFGNVDPTPESWTWRVDSVAPVVIDLVGPAAVTSDPDALLTFDADEPATFECRLNAGPWTNCATTAAYPDLPDGAYTFEVRARDAAGNVSAPAPGATWTWTVLTDPPETVITSGPTGLVNTASASVTFTSPDAPVTFECRLDGGAFLPCTSPWTATALGQGAHVLAVRAVAAGILADPTPDSRTWTVDTVAPTASITSGPTGTVGIGASTFGFTANEASSFSCVLDGGPAQPCASPWPLGSLGSGPHTFSVTATDAAGNTGPAATRTWTVDGVAPVVTITAGPPSLTSATSASVSFTVDDPSATVECSNDGGPWQSCTSPASRSSLSDGSHSVGVRATDAAGNVSAPAARTWTVDTVAPVVTITGGTTGTTAATTGTATFTVDDPTANTECRVDAGPWAACATPASFAGLAHGPHAIGVRATDPAGNVGPVATRVFTVDTVAPQVTITGGPTGTVAVIDATITFTVDDPAATAACRLDGGAWAPCTSPATFTGLGNGIRTVEVRATDAVGNVGPVASRTWTILTVEPETIVTSAPPALSNSNTASIAFTSNDAGATFACKVDTGAFQPCPSPLVLTGLGEGEHQVQIRAEALGLQDPSPAVVTWTVDTVAPLLTVSERPSGTTTVADSRFTFAADDPTASVACQVDGGPWEPCTSPFVPNLSNGLHTVGIRAQDPAGNLSNTVTTTWTVDATAPQVQIVSGPAGITTVRDVTFGFTVDDPAAVVECRLDLGAWVPCTSPRTENGLDDGPHSFDVRATDAAGNRTAEGRTFFIDATPPVVTITGGPAGSTTVPDATLTFTVDDPAAAVECRLGAAAWAPCSSPVVFTGLAEGTYQFQVRATDQYGNVSVPVTRSWTVDTTAPTVTITGGPSGVVNVDDATFTFDADEPVDARCRIDGGPWQACTAPVTYPDLAVGDHTFEVQGTDAAGLTSTVASRSFTVQILGQPALSVAVAAVSTAGAPLATTGLGDDFMFRVSVSNTGAVASEDTIVTVPLSADLRLAGTLPVGCTAPDADGPVTCDLAGVGAGATETIDLSVQAAFACTVFGDSADNVLLGTTGSDVICGGGGSDDIRGRGGNDTVWGYGPRGVGVSTGASVAYGPGSLAGASVVDAAVTVAGTDGNDTVTTGSLNDVVDGEEGNDTITTGGGTDVVIAGDGDDVVQTGSGTSTVSGGDGADRVTGGTAADVVDGGAGADTISTLEGTDSVTGGDGDDVVQTGSGPSTVSGGGGADQVTGGTAADVVDGGAGADTISTLEGTDSVTGGDGNDVITAGAGPNVVRAGTGDDQVSASNGTVFGDAGRDTITGTAVADVIDGGSDADAISAGGGNDTIAGGAGDDVVSAGDATDTVDAGEGSDTVFGGSGGDTLTGGPGADRMYGETGNDTLYGEDGNDQLDGGGGVDSLYGAADDDQLLGGDADDRLFSGDGLDVADGGAGADQVYGGNGDDTVRGGPGADVEVNGQAGSDWVYGDDGSDPLVIGGDGDDRLVDGGLGNDVVFGNAGDDRLQGGNGADEVNAGVGDDPLVDGGPGNDQLNGADGNDVMFGGDGADTVTGGAGLDEIHGGLGNDGVQGGDDRDDLFGDDGNDDLDGGDADDVLSGGPGLDILLGRAGNDDLLGGDSHDYLDGSDGDDYLNGQGGRDVLRGNAGTDTLDGGAAAGTSQSVPTDHWNRLYGDAGTDICYFGPGLGDQMTNYRDGSCELRDVGLAVPGAGWLNGAQVRLDRGRFDPATYPG